MKKFLEASICFYGIHCRHINLYTLARIMELDGLFARHRNSSLNRLIRLNDANGVGKLFYTCVHMPSFIALIQRSRQGSRDDHATDQSDRWRVLIYRKFMHHNFGQRVLCVHAEMTYEIVIKAVDDHCPVNLFHYLRSRDELRDAMRQRRRIFSKEGSFICLFQE